MSDVKTLQEIAERQFEAMQLVDELDQKLKDAKEALRRIEEEELPSAMEDAEMLDFTTRSGLRVTIEPMIRVGKVTNPDALKWLEESGEAGMIKSDVIVAFGKQDEALAKSLCEQLEGEGMQTRLDQHVHPQTIKSYLKKMREEGEPIDFSLFGAHEFKRAKITLPKRSKK